MKFCPNCGAEVRQGDNACGNCGKMFVNNNQYNNNNNNQCNNNQQKSKIAAGLLGIFLGAWGIHNFYLGNNSKGVTQIILTIVTCGIAGIWGFIEGILILTGSINTDANGNPLKD